MGAVIISRELLISHPNRHFNNPPGRQYTGWPSERCALPYRHELGVPFK